MTILDQAYAAHLNRSDTPLDRDQWEAENASRVMRELEIFSEAYATALFWSSTDATEDGDTINLDDYMTSTQADDHCRAEAADFFSAYYADLTEAAQRPGYSLELAGHDFALTRNHHGAGYWDRGLGELGARLTEAAHARGECWPYLGDDELVYIN